jgi:hypothetical protein
MTTKRETEVTILTTGRVLVGNQPAASLNQRSIVEGVVGTTATCAVSSSAEMHIAGSKTDAESESAWNKNSAMRGTVIIMVHTMTNPTAVLP